MTMRKPFKSNPPVEKAPAPIVPQDNKRTFDARPKPGDDRRREDMRYRPAAHIDPVRDEAADETTKEDE